jgi:NAD(P)-dependent dehydrogenase (short-subunit alcohol dehydrogenase family)
VRVENALYSMTKAAIEHLTRCLAAELASDGIRVNAIAPGPCATSILDSLGGDIDKVHEELTATVALGRMGEPEELAWWIAQLVDPHAVWVTGAVIPIDGGQTLGVGRRR